MARRAGTLNVSCIINCAHARKRLNGALRQPPPLIPSDPRGQYAEGISLAAEALGKAGYRGTAELTAIAARRRLGGLQYIGAVGSKRFGEIL